MGGVVGVVNLGRHMTIIIHRKRRRGEKSFKTLQKLRYGSLISI